MPVMTLYRYSKALAGVEQKLGRNDDLYFKHCYLIVKVLKKLERFEEALEACKKALQGRETLHGTSASIATNFESSIRWFVSFRVEQSPSQFAIEL